MKPYSADLHQRVLADCDEGEATSAVASKYRVSGRLGPPPEAARRETGSIEAGLRAQRHRPPPKWAPHAEAIAAAVRRPRRHPGGAHRARLEAGPGHPPRSGGRSTPWA